VVRSAPAIDDADAERFNEMACLRPESVIFFKRIDRAAAGVLQNILCVRQAKQPGRKQALAAGNARLVVLGEWVIEHGEEPGPTLNHPVRCGRRSARAEIST
jgi:hypothetical protein